ncbi:P-loop ATPase, Sll1717 family [Streptomyces sp. cg40]|uniref:P-loop ATPase, Sll1717 family n=1 Tax=Streptomyces sp. cg40 TaxID=3419764 RepID=UPI003CFBEB2D
MADTDTETDLVARLFFGRDDAENDNESGLLQVGFRPNSAYDAALSGRKSLIIGRKGSGKSAICMRLMAPGVYSGATVLITPDDAAGEEIRRFELQGLTADTAKSLIWRYVFAVQAARYLVRHVGRHRRITPPSVRVLKRFLRASGEGDELRLYDRLLNGRQGLQSSLALEAFGVKASVDLAGSSEGARADRQLRVLENGVLAAFKELGCGPRHEPLLLLVDQVEQVWSLDPDSNSMVVGLLLASKHAAVTFRQAVRCVLFLRSDIYDSLTFGNADKFRGDEARLGWTYEDLYDVSLIRARASLKVPLTPEQLWGEVFPARVEGEKTADYLFSRALPRPRDAIQFLNLCRDTAKERGHRRIREADVVLATMQFSQWKLQDLASEYLVNYPFLGRLFAMLEGAGFVVLRSALQQRFDAHQEALHRQFPEYAEALTLEGTLDTLFAVSFLGVKRGNGVVYGGGSQLPVQPHETEFHIHPCFRPALSALTPIELHPYNPRARAYRLESQQVTQLFSPDAGFVVGREFALLESLLTSCERILRQLTRAELPEEVRGEVSRQVGRILSEASAVRERLRAGEYVNVDSHVVEAADYLGALAGGLVAHGIGEEDRTGGSYVVQRIQREAATLIRAVGGAAGGSLGGGE